MDTTPAYRINSPRVIFDTIEGELLLAHMERGTCYTTDDVGAVVWSLIEAGYTVHEMHEALRSSYEGDAETIAGAVASFLAELADEDLISIVEAPAERGTPHHAWRDGRRPFRPPALHAYGDMQDMLRLDPVHDVGAAGWPAPKLGDAPPIAPRAE